MTEVPTMDEVLKDAPKNWGKWGDQDEVGALNYLTVEEVFRGVRHIKSGTVCTLQRLIGDPQGDPVWPGRTSAEKTMVLDESSWDGDGAPQFPALPLHCALMRNLGVALTEICDLEKLASHSAEDRRTRSCTRRPR
jgi:hypothetical protein